MSRPVPNPGILDIAPYTPGKTPVPEPGRKVFKLSANETPFGPSPKAIEAFKHVADHLEDYPEGTSRVLREAIGRAFGLDPNRIICGAGSDEILNLLADQRDERSLTYVLVSHDLAVIAHMCDRVLIMKGGTFVDELSKADLQAGTTHDAYTRELFEASFL